MPTWRQAALSLGDSSLPWAYPLAAAAAAAVAAAGVAGVVAVGELTMTQVTLQSCALVAQVWRRRGAVSQTDRSDAGGAGAGELGR
ncbi:MAG: hypothetical protein LBS27_11610 [Bifidobacteriaceae bacterium]|nr:hypothetical protein [Bifidobacteriaceae bacterium]